ncbi:MAG: tRNA (adenosine(37)-N6)-threonylcarbamoyltransferase complex transferase subunit TsaD [Elusimicrobia bacterium]|nr:tRNA (adenosine(37)-N6)-threonylcarbamoyltransferase complex transferase subunit TsaD [Elusimicrobiota bacterium]
MRVLGIETSCDETAAAVVEDGHILSNVVSSQIRLHRRFHGVVPELAARAHLQRIGEVVETALAGRKVDAVAFARGPGLMGPLLVGKMAALAAAETLGCPVVAVNHLEGHVFAAELSGRIRFPLVTLIVSGGHTDLLLCRAPGRYRVLGRTRDDAAGEAYDKVARMLGLGYPGGPAIDRLARRGDPQAVAFARPLLPGTWDFSFAGIKTAMLYHLRDLERKPTRKETADLCASFQEAVVETLVRKTVAAALSHRVKQVVVGGGVAANARLREAFAEAAASRGLRVSIPPPILCTDNGAMLAQAASHRLRRRRVGRSLRCDPGLGFENWGG